MQPLQQTVSAVLVDILRRAPLSPEKVTFAWRAAVGPAIARVSSVQMSPDGVIHVTCGDDHWRREIRRSAPMITSRLAALLGAEVVKRVKVCPGKERASVAKRATRTERGSRGPRE